MTQSLLRPRNLLVALLLLLGANQQPQQLVSAQQQLPQTNPLFPVSASVTPPTPTSTQKPPDSATLSVPQDDYNRELLDYERELFDATFNSVKNDKDVRALVSKHHNNVDLYEALKQLTILYPTITRLHSVGESVEGRKLWVLEISEQPGEHVRLKPEFRYIANMHGNEVVGREMLLALARLLLENYHDNGVTNQHNATAAAAAAAADSNKSTPSKFITKLIKQTRIHLMPSMNPDGYERSVVACKFEEPSRRGRLNANNVDLNRNFPDPVLKTQLNAGTQPEVRALMDWSRREPFVLSANLHGGATVASFPYDGSLNTSAVAGSEPRLTPDHQLYRELAMAYTLYNPMMKSGEMCYDKCTDYHPETFPDNSVIAGSAWYSLYGGMQDWMYENTNDYHITLELGCNQYPPAEALYDYWQLNKASLLNYMRQVHKGIKGLVQDEQSGALLANVSVRVRDNSHTISSSQYGDYFRLLPAGQHEIIFEHPHYEPTNLSVFLHNGMAQIHNIKLKPRNGSTSSSSGWKDDATNEATKLINGALKDNNGVESTGADHSLVVATLVMSVSTLLLLLSLVGAYFIQRQRYNRSQSVSVELQPTGRSSGGTGVSLGAGKLQSTSTINTSLPA